MADGARMDVERWYSAAELAGLPGLPSTARRVFATAKRESWPSRPRNAVGGGREYRITALPPVTQAALALKAARVARAASPDMVATALADAPAARMAPSREAIESAWARYERTPDRLKEVAKRRLRALQAVDALCAGGMAVMQARAVVAAQLQREGVRGGSVQSLCRWAADVAGVDRAYWLALLLPSYSGRLVTAEIEPAAWDIFKADYLRLEAPSAASCYRRLERIADRHADWAALPVLVTFIRRIEREIPPQVLTLARKGEEALMREYPAQERDRSLFTAMEGVNADGHVWDVGVTFPDGTTGRPVIVGWQDLYSGKILAWRIGQTESSDLVRLAFCDMVRSYGIPGHVWLDNGRAFASKYLTGGTPNRYRFKVKEEDPVGIITALGVQVHWVTPYHGQAKPIERAWRDFCANIAKHPAFAGAYLGNSVANKPENYGSRLVPFEEFARVVESEIHAHNARVGRRSKVCDGRSFDVAFAESYSANPIRKATAEQLRTLLLAAEVVSASRTDGSVRLAGNRYWCEALAQHKGQKLVLRFDPMQLHGSVHTYQLDGEYVAEAQYMVGVGFSDTNASREHARAKAQWRRAGKQQLEAERRMQAAAVAAQLPDMDAPELPAASVIEDMFTRPVAPPQDEQLAATGTDDVARAVSLNEYLKRIQEALQRDQI
jgi:transposase InsO family protein